MEATTKLISRMSLPCLLRPLIRTCARSSRSFITCSSESRVQQPFQSPLWSREGLLCHSRALCTETKTAPPLPRKQPKKVKVTFVDRDGDEMVVDAKVGDSLLEVAKEYDVDLEGACEGTLSCSTCHLIVDPAWFDKIPDPITEEEQDMLDMAFELTDTSRLGCQILVSEALEGIRLKVPAVTRDIRNT